MIDKRTNGFLDGAIWAITSSILITYLQDINTFIFAAIALIWIVLTPVIVVLIGHYITDKIYKEANK